MDSINDLIVSALRPIYGSTLALPDLIRQHYTAELGTPFPTHEQLRTLYPSESGQSISDAMRNYYLGFTTDTVDFTTMVDSDSLPPPWIDCDGLGRLPSHAWDYSQEQDRLCIRSGKVARGELSGSDTVMPEVPGSGVRGTAFYPSPFSDDFYVKVGWVGETTRAGAPCAHFNPAHNHLAVCGPYWNSFFGAWEMFTVGAESGGFQYLDVAFDTPPVGAKVLELRSVNGEIAGYVDGVRKVGPIPVPAPLLGKSSHGLHLSTIDADTFVGTITTYEFGPYAGNLGGARTTPTVLGVPTTQEVTSSNTLTCAYPAGIQAGEQLIAIVGGTQAGGLAATGWTHVASDRASISGVVSLGVLRKIADGTETGNFNITKGGTVGHLAGIIIRLPACNPTVPLIKTFQQNSVASTNLTAPTNNILGPHKGGLWAGVVPANSTITLPANFSLVAATGTGGSAINLSVGYRDWHAVTTSPYGFTGTATGALVGTIASSLASIGGNFIINPPF